MVPLVRKQIPTAKAAGPFRVVRFKHRRFAKRIAKLKAHFHQLPAPDLHVNPLLTVSKPLKKPPQGRIF